MEQTKQYTALVELALKELSTINFSGATVIPAGKAVEALYALRHILTQDNAADTGEEDADG